MRFKKQKKKKQETVWKLYIRIICVYKKYRQPTNQPTSQKDRQAGNHAQPANQHTSQLTIQPINLSAS